MKTEEIIDQKDEESLVRDKIFDNKYDEVEMDSADMNFNIDSSFQSKSYEYTIDEQLVHEKIDALINKDSRYDKYLKPDENGNFKKMNKSDINDVYSYVTHQLKNEPRIEIFSTLCSMFDIDSSKFYESLSNSFKTELITQLKSRGFLKNRNSLF